MTPEQKAANHLRRYEALEEHTKQRIADALLGDQEARAKWLEMRTLEKECLRTQAHYLDFLHIRRVVKVPLQGFGPNEDEDDYDLLPTGGMTVTYTIEKANVAKVATALCHPRDLYIKHIGRYNSALAYHAGNFVLLPIPKTHEYRPGDFLRSIFEICVSGEGK